jgi:hypothetical protein
MKRMVSIAALTIMAIGCSTRDRTISDPSGANRPWEPANVESNYSARPVTSSTESEKHVWTGTPVPNVPPKHDDWRPE